MAAKTNKGYDQQSISALKGADRVRKRPAVIFGSDGLEGCQHSFLEILANAVDEAREGYGNRILVSVYHDGSLEVEDFGRGVPLGYNSREGRYNWELVFCELYAGGKYNNNDSGSAYSYSLGLNGLGACATQYASEYMQVTSCDGTTFSQMQFRCGEPVGTLLERPLSSRDSKRQGSIIRWKPDLNVFTDIAIPEEFFVTTLRRQSVVNGGLQFILRVEQEDGSFRESEFLYPNGIQDYIRELSDGVALTEPVFWHLETEGRDRADKPDYKVRADIAFCVVRGGGSTEYYHNSSFLEYGGAPDKALRSSFPYVIDRYLRKNGKYNKNESKVTAADVTDSLIAIINSSSTQTSYENQTKKAINNLFIAKALNEFIRERLEIYFAEHPEEAGIFTSQVLLNKRARETAERTKVDVRKKLAAGNDLSGRVEKFVSCRSRDPNVRELYIVEGDSALTSVKLGRDAEFQAIIPVRGKTLNCMKSSYAKIFENKIIVDLLKVIGCGAELDPKMTGGEVQAFDLGALKWSKIIICTDADEDGFQIRTLLLTMFYRLLPTLIEEGRIYIAESPLFEITVGQKTFFAYNENEKNQFLAGIGDRKFTLQRSKGLGENEPEMMWQTTMNPATRRLIAIRPAGREETLRIFETLLGDSLAARKRFIAEHGHEYLAQADV